MASRLYSLYSKNVEKSREQKSPPCVKEGGTRSVTGGLLRKETIPQSATLTAPFTQGSL